MSILIRQYNLASKCLYLLSARRCLITAGSSITSTKKCPKRRAESNKPEQGASTNPTKAEVNATTAKSSPGADLVTAARAKLLKESGIELRSRLASVGLATQGTKASMADKFLSHVQSVASKPFPSDVFSLDMGYLNIGITHIKITASRTKPMLALTKWELVNPDLPPVYNVHNYAAGAINIVTQHLLPPTASNQPQHMAYIIERQHWRPSTAMAHILQRVRGMEAMIFAILLDRTSHSPHHVTVESVQARSVMDHLGYNLLSNSASKKKRAITLVKNWLDGSKRVDRDLAELTYSEAHVKMFEATSKKDDLADSLFMAVAWIEWRLVALEYGRKELGMT
ncbi:hypothetical protein SeMB42_g00516 [Synchytrium endobioticum]|uniref:SAP domain-containing protein n=1 Tax=Synchytrium endobioticum TaxID=286115 RepID=A0A507DKP3_9FUNG|nr:hypothetical protein SeLEV6574_g00058 [Synchytrium endobioticum]TPX53993.1 hypothetical protein SeMB42_g00516 [Synchytrium endobioticum]